MKNMYRLIKIIIVGIIFGFYSCGENDVSLENKKDEISLDNFVTEQQAISIAGNFMSQVSSSLRSSNNELQIVYTDLHKPATRGSAMMLEKKNDKPAYYIVNVGDRGYVVVSGYDAAFPVLGYSTESAFSSENIPVNMSSVLDGYRQEICYARQLKMLPDVAMKNIWENMLSGTLQMPQTRAARAVRPLLGAIKWNQRPYYNAYCPANCPVGCVATATCQIMRYWQYPQSGTGQHSYRSSYGTLSFNYKYALNWSRMPKERLRSPNNDVARFCYGVAVGVNMSFSPRGSGAYQESVPNMLKKYYKYPSSVQSKDRRYYSTYAWENMIREELSASRPVQYAGYGRGGGHSFVCDGYDSRGYFHFNWGWGGVSDGYFLLSALNPGSLGTGGGSGGFNSGHTIIVGFQPPGGGGDVDPDDDPPIPETDYCASKSLSYAYMYIRYVKIDNMVNYSSGRNYSDFTQKKVYVRAGNRAYLQFAPGYSYYTYRTYWRAWVDLNGNKRFEDNEEIIKRYDNRYFNDSFVVPYNTPKGEYRIRISMSNSGYPDPCETFTHGEVEDYTLVVQ